MVPISKEYIYESTNRGTSYSISSYYSISVKKEKGYFYVKGLKIIFTFLLILYCLKSFTSVLFEKFLQCTHFLF